MKKVKVTSMPSGVSEIHYDGPNNYDTTLCNLSLDGCSEIDEYDEIEFNVKGRVNCPHCIGIRDYVLGRLKK